MLNKNLKLVLQETSGIQFWIENVWYFKKEAEIKVQTVIAQGRSYKKKPFSRSTIK